ncbi:OLC1v1025126C1 [Oldenlandia corymbosa var. corymbosa]|uniref:OLC1v1025126C1 n=1 Tax=Oldenlandia corymbosa var. corymbosa TaxID=529605 RepID=A0AAV1C5E2_OLDCO|nr:OLC1v1025126C1 [Oldenlandia corymbosa var. corymbosa]
MATPRNEPKTPGGDPTAFTAPPTLQDTPEEGPSRPKPTAEEIQEFVRANFHELERLLQNNRQDDRGKEPMDPKEKRRTSFPDPSSSSSGQGDEESGPQRNRSPAHRIVRTTSSGSRQGRRYHSYTHYGSMKYGGNLPFSSEIEKFTAGQKFKSSQNIGVYDGSSDPDDHLNKCSFLDKAGRSILPTLPATEEVPKSSRRAIHYQAKGSGDATCLRGVYCRGECTNRIPNGQLGKFALEARKGDRNSRKEDRVADTFGKDRRGQYNWNRNRDVERPNREVNQVVTGDILSIIGGPAGGDSESQRKARCGKVPDKDTNNRRLKPSKMITFSYEDLVPERQVGADAVVIRGRITNKFVHRIYVDGGSSAEIMYWHCFVQYGEGVRRMMRMVNTPLVDFANRTI